MLSAKQKFFTMPEHGKEENAPFVNAIHLATCRGGSLLANGLDKGCPWSIDCEDTKILVPHALAVNPNAQGKGIGKLVVRNIIDMAKTNGKKTVRLDILVGNIAAERLYTGMGFRFVVSKTMFYEDTGWTEYAMYERIL